MALKQLGNGMAGIAKAFNESIVTAMYNAQLSVLRVRKATRHVPFIGEEIRNAPITNDFLDDRSLRRCMMLSSKRVQRIYRSMASAEVGYAQSSMLTAVQKCDQFVSWDHTFWGAQHGVKEVYHINGVRHVAPTHTCIFTVLTGTGQIAWVSYEDSKSIAEQEDKSLRWLKDNGQSDPEQAWTIVTDDPMHDHVVAARVFGTNCSLRKDIFHVLASWYKVCYATDKKSIRASFMSQLSACFYEYDKEDVKALYAKRKTMYEQKHGLDAQEAAARAAKDTSDK